MEIKKVPIRHMLIKLGITVVIGLVYFYINLPAINLHDPEFYMFVFLLAAVYVALSVLLTGVWRIQGGSEFLRALKQQCLIPVVVCLALLVIYMLGSLLSSVIFRAGAYSNLLVMSEASGTFTDDISPVSYDQIPLLDEDSAKKLGDRKLGELSDMVSQFEVSDLYTQINYLGRPVRVTPLLYGDVIKWYNNRDAGLPAYIITDMVTQNVEVVRLDEGMKYSTSELFSRNISRHLRFNYPTFIFGEPTFEIDEQGTPYWVCPKVEKTIGLFGGTDINGAVLVNAITGECEYLENPPTWVDRVYTADLIVEQYDYYGKYSNGFFNSMFGQRGVTVTTEGYNYLAIDDDVYMYTGITSVNTDESNVGFILANQRTKETIYYPIAGAEEYSAMDSAKGVVQHLNYKATFPLLLNIAGQPTYFMSLKDAAGLVKMYAMVNVSQYQIVSTGSTVAECEINYITMLDRNNISTGEEVSSSSVSGVISDIRSAVIEGTSHYYIRLEGDDFYYIISSADNELAVILNPGDAVTLTVGFGEGELRSAIKVARAKP